MNGRSLHGQRGAGLTICGSSSPRNDRAGSDPHSVLRACLNQSERQPRGRCLPPDHMVLIRLNTGGGRRVTTATGSGPAWPALPYAEWVETCTALHLWTQIVGKYRLARTPWVNHSWHATLYVTTQGLTTGPVPDNDLTVTLTFDHVVRTILALAVQLPRMKCRKAHHQPDHLRRGIEAQERAGRLCSGFAAHRHPPAVPAPP